MGELAIVHDIPGRVRLRLPVRRGSDTEAFPTSLADFPGVERCVWSPRTRSLLVHYRVGAVSASAIADAISRETGLAVAPGVEERGPAGSAELRRSAPDGAVRVTLSGVVRACAVEANDRVARRTRGLVDLAGLVSILLTLWAIREIVRGQMAPLAWSSALWYAHGLFRDYTVPSD